MAGGPEGSCPPGAPQEGFGAPRRQRRVTALDATVGTDIQRRVLPCLLIGRRLERPMHVVRRCVLLPRRQGQNVGDFLRQRTPASRMGSAWLGPLDRLYHKVVCFNVFSQFRGLHNRWHTMTPCPNMLPMRMGAASCGACRCLGMPCGVEGGTVLNNHHLSKEV